MYSEFKIEELTMESIPSILSICNKELGNGFVTNQCLIDYINNPKCLSLIAKDFENEKVIAVSISFYLSQEKFKEYLHPSQYTYLNESFILCKEIGVFKLIAIEKQFQKKGLGSIFIDLSFEFFKKNNIHKVSAFAWESKTGIHMKNIFDRNHLSIVCRIPDFWNIDSLEKKYNCPECGTPPCRCTAVVFGKEI